MNADLKRVVGRLTAIENAIVSLERAMTSSSTDNHILNGTPGKLKATPAFKVARDVEMRSRVITLLRENAHSQKEILEICRAEFGNERTPSKAALSRYVCWLKRGRDQET